MLAPYSEMARSKELSANPQMPQVGSSCCHSLRPALAYAGAFALHWA